MRILLWSLFINNKVLVSHRNIKFGIRLKLIIILTHDVSMLRAAILNFEISASRNPVFATMSTSSILRDI